MRLAIGSGSPVREPLLLEGTPTPARRMVIEWCGYYKIRDGRVRKHIFERSRPRVRQAMPRCWAAQRGPNSLQVSNARPLTEQPPMRATTLPRRDGFGLEFAVRDASDCSDSVISEFDYNHLMLR